MSNIQTIHLGCRLNFYESEQMKHLSQKKGLSNVTIINSCAVTAQAERQSRQAVRAAKKRDPKNKIIVAGCAVRDKKTWQQMDEVDEALDKQDKLNFLASDTSGTFAPQARSRAFLKIQDGCDWQCTFCHTRLARGSAISMPAPRLIKEANFLYQQGHLEITLTGADSTSYGKDLSDKPRLGDLLEQLLQHTPSGLKFGLSSLDPAAIDEKLFALLGSEKRIKPFLHFSAQSGDDLILKRMKRRHSRTQMLALCHDLTRTRNFAFGADLIAGFPTEDESAFQNSLSLLREGNIVFAHIFPFSPRPGTKAALMPCLPSAIIKQRASTLRDQAEKLRDNFLQAQVGTTQLFLAEDKSKGRNNFNCQANWGAGEKRNGYHKMRVLSHTQGVLMVRPLRHPA